MQNLLVGLRVSLISILTLISVWAVSYIHGHPSIGIDDANIYFSYADAFSKGHGFVYNIGGERVEGFTSFAWLMVSSLAFRFSLSESSLLVFSIFCVIGVQAIMTSIIHHEAEQKHLNTWLFELLYLLLLFSSPAYIAWMSITLMDSCLWNVYLALGLLFILFPPTKAQSKIAAIALFATLPLVRPEGLLCAPALIVLMGMRILSQGQKHNLSTAWISIGAYLACVISLIAFRLKYFGHPLPNTYYAKVSSSLGYNLSEGFRYLLAYLHSSVIATAAFLTILFWLVRQSTILLRLCISRSAGLFLRKLNAEDFIALTALLLFITPVISGGDHFNLFRFFQPCYPVLCLLLILSLQNIVQAASKRHAPLNLGPSLTIIASSSLLVGLSYGLYHVGHQQSWKSLQNGSPIQHEFEIATRGMSIGESLRTSFQDQQSFPSIGVIAAGGFKRAYPGQVIDLMGLNNTTMAHIEGDRRGVKNHAAFEPEGLFQLQPDVILAFPPEDPTDSNFTDRVLKGIFRDAQFQSLYTFGELNPTGSNTKPSVSLFFHKDYLARLLQSQQWIYVEDTNWTRNWANSQSTSSF